MTDTTLYRDGIVVRHAGTDDVDGLGRLLCDCVVAGASVGFLDDLDDDTSVRWARQHVTDPDRRVLVAADRDGRVLGTVALILATELNGRHRATLVKLLISSDARRRGLATRLLAEIEVVAREEGRDLLVLDTETGSPAQDLYARNGYEVVGVIDRYAASPDGTLAPTTFMAKHLV